MIHVLLDTICQLDSIGAPDLRSIPRCQNTRRIRSDTDQHIEACKELELNISPIKLVFLNRALE